MLDVATDLVHHHDEALSLMEEALKIWITTVRFAATYDPQGE